MDFRGIAPARPACVCVFYKKRRAFTKGAAAGRYFLPKICADVVSPPRPGEYNKTVPSKQITGPKPGRRALYAARHIGYMILTRERNHCMKNAKFSRRSFLKAGAAASVASLVAANAAVASAAAPAAPAAADNGLLGRRHGRGPDPVRLLL